jgi:NAD(P)-dependent dehydrogenase (short-subunit alcohol dehydrogenase family)
MTLVLKDRIALVTGASRGIGRACALALAEAGAHVVATARTKAGLEELDDEVFALTGAHATLVPLDVKDGKAIDQLGAILYERFHRLDILVSAAGDLGLITPVAHLEPSTWDRAVAVNMTANYRLIRSMDPLLRLSDAARAIFLTSRIAIEPQAFWGPYAATKAGLEALVRTYADEMAHTAVRATLVDPGRMRTKMHATAFPGLDPETITPPEAIKPLIVELARADQEPPLRVRFPDWAAERASA